MTVVYLAHPVAQRDGRSIDDNVANATAWLRWLVLHTELAVCAPWIPYVQALLEADHRERGLRDDVAMVLRCDAVILTGYRVSDGMAREALAAREKRIPIFDLTDPVDWAPPVDGSVRDLVVMARLGRLLAKRKVR